MKSPGAWPSSWTPELVSTASAFPVYWTGQLEVDRDGAVYALIRRPEEGGRSVIERVAPGPTQTLTPDGFNLRTTIYEYGGSAFLVRDGEFFFINEDQRWYRHSPGSAPAPITPPAPTAMGAGADAAAASSASASFKTPASRSARSWRSTCRATPSGPCWWLATTSPGPCSA